jgi:hypothetical protein
MKSSVRPGSHFVGGVAGDLECQPQMLVECAARLRDVHVGQARVVHAAGCDHHVVDRCGQVLKEPREAIRIGGVEGGAAQRVKLARGLLQPLGVAGGEDDLGPRGASTARRLQADAGATADHDDGLAEQFGLELDRRGSGAGRHDSSGGCCWWCEDGAELGSGQAW